MAKDNRGGYQKPQKPAAISGPGSMSQRTDGGPTQAPREMGGGEYGETKDMRDIQSSAPMSASARQPTHEHPAPAAPNEGVVPFGAASNRPNEPVTAGNPLGPGAGPAALGTSFSVQRLSEAMRQIQSEDVDGSLDELILALESNGL